LKENLSHACHSIDLSLHLRKHQLLQSAERVDVLGYKVSPKRRWVRNDNGYPFQRNLKSNAEKFAAEKLSSVETLQGIHSCIGHARHAETS
jgi:hypothetical protein